MIEVRQWLRKRIGDYSHWENRWPDHKHEGYKYRMRRQTAGDIGEHKCKSRPNILRQVTMRIE